MVMANPYDKVMDNVILTASQEELTLMLYEGAIKFCNQAIIAIEKNEYERAHNSIVRVQDILRELQVTLDTQYEITINMNSLYDYMHGLMVDANIEKNADKIQEVIGYFREFRDTWKEAMKLAKVK